MMCLWVNIYQHPQGACCLNVGFEPTISAGERPAAARLLSKMNIHIYIYIYIHFTYVGNN